MTDEEYKKLLTKYEEIGRSEDLRNDPVGFTQGEVKKKSGRGGRRPGSGAKPKISQEWMTAQLAEDWEYVKGQLMECIANGDPLGKMAAITLYMKYFAGLPKQVTEITGTEGAPLTIQWVEQRTYPKDIVELTNDDDEDEDQKLIGE